MDVNALKINNFVINIATVNGSGSQSANLILLKSLFKMGIPVGGKNVFPSNIAGLPTWFWIRANAEGYVGRRKEADIVIAMNPQTIQDDTKTLKSGGLFIYNSDLPFRSESARTDIQYIAVPFKKLVDQASDSIKTKKLLINIVYVGVLAELLKIDTACLMAALENQLGGKASVLEANRKAMQVGMDYAKENLLSTAIAYRAEKMNKTQGKIMIEGNTAAALGLVFGGATFAAWYPITPSSSVMESFIKYSEKYRKDQNGKNTVAIVQAEDELASICMVLGAGWAGARAVTATSGPGVSLMAEAAGFAYYAEVPSVIWNVQRVGPSTGMPTRTAQGDLLLSLYLSHGDTKHPLLIPGSAKECFEFAQLSLDLSERLQTLILVLSDLDLGMNVWMEDEFAYPDKPLDRGKVLSAQDLERTKQFQRYADPDGDGIAPRTLPGTKHDLAAYFTRGSGHNAKAAYTERSDEYKEVIDRLARKWETAKKYVPAPVIRTTGKAIGILTYGTTDSVVPEALALLSANGIAADDIRIRALPFNGDVEKFIRDHDRVYVIDQNRDGQMWMVLRTEFAEIGNRLISIRHYDGTPITAEAIVEPLLAKEHAMARQGGLHV